MNISTEAKRSPSEHPHAESSGDPLAPTPFVDVPSTGPIRAELFGLERLDEHARQLAAVCALATGKPSNSPLPAEFAANAKFLDLTHKQILVAGSSNEGRGLDAEWLADNFHIIDEVIREVRHDLPKGYDAELPKLVTGNLDGYPRVYAMALSLVAHADSELDEARIMRFASAFQEIVPLTIGELWALPTMFRLVLIDNLRRLAEQMLWSGEERRRAERWGADVLAGNAPPVPSEPSDPFVVRLLQMLRDQGADANSALGALDSVLERRGADANEILRREHQRQAANQISVANSVISLRLLAALDWNAFFEAQSQVDAILRAEPTGVYSQQDFRTRDSYRRSVERIARRSDASESEVAQRAVRVAAQSNASDPARRHLGYYLIGPGSRAFKAECGYRSTPGERLGDAVRRHPSLTYFGLVGGLFGILLFSFAAIGLGANAGWGMLALLVLLLAVPVSDLAVGLVNHLLTLSLTPRVLPKLDFKDGIPVDCATMVVMPSMLIRPRSAEALAERLEIHYLANPDPRLRFALLTDFADAPAETMPEDDSYVREGIEQIERLNSKYATPESPLFFLFHRRRLWNPAQNCWMGWERKRGKLSEFNRLLRGDRETTYSVMSTGPADLPRIRFVITLDSDTQMPRDTAGRLVGTIAHPLNQPRFDPAVGRVVEGFGVLQPRVSFHLTAATHSRFAALLAASGGIDPYSTAASDTYMDLFGVGSFTGKGIYDVDAFEAATGATFPDNQILSHDLIEGNYARCGLLSDTELFDDFPARYHAYSRREHRWVRGDWQLLPWLGSRVPSTSGPRPNRLPMLERWKILDNLRRSLVAPSLVLFLAMAWTVLPGSPLFWTLVALAVPGLPIVQRILGASILSMRGRSLSPIRALQESGGATLAQVALNVVLMADQSRVALDAILRTLVRLFVTRRNLLEWETAASTERRLGEGFWNFARDMWQGPVIALTIGMVTAFLRPASLIVAAPVLLAWILSPLVAYWISRPKPRLAVPLSDDDRRLLKQVALKTWSFFERFVGEGDNWLPPDNFQEIPEPRIAHRTSPTNQGLLLLSTLSAHDLGFLGVRRLTDRLEKTFETFDRMETHWGHFYNWYDTRTLQPLPPRYISTVDSGNLLGCLITLRQGLREALRAPIVGEETRRGIADMLGMAVEGLDLSIIPIQSILSEDPGDLLAWDDWLRRLDWAVVTLRGQIQQRPGDAESKSSDNDFWLQTLVARIREQSAELESIAPWLATLRSWETAASSIEWPSPAVAEGWTRLRERLIRPASLLEISENASEWLATLETLAAAKAEPSLNEIADAIRSSSATDLATRLQQLMERSSLLAKRMDFRPLYKPERHLFSIGYNLSQSHLDGACYDLLASESCLTSFLTIARGEAPRRHWFQLGRPFIRCANGIGLISWGGTMFEYLMPRLMMRALPGTLVAEACGAAVARQIEYGEQKGVPWGISESAFSAQYPDGDYRYQAFGVPGLGLKRGLERDLVIAPYATAMAAMISPHRTLRNIRRLIDLHAAGRYGFYEAIDFTHDRLPKGQNHVLVRSYMAHHQGMSLVAITNALLGDPMPRRFHAEPMVRAVELLLQERMPVDVPLVDAEETAQEGSPVENAAVAPLLSRRITTPNTPVPRTHVLSNSNYHVILTNAGGGRSICRDLDVTRWREDATRDAHGLFCYVRDLDRDLVWSAGYQPICRASDDYEVLFAGDKATFRRRDGGIETTMEVSVSPEACAEVRRVTLTNHDTQPRNLELTSYVEIVLSPHGADLAHPAFGKLFLETEWVEGSEALVCHRRPRSAEDRELWAVHVIAVDRSATGGIVDGPVQFETDRARFLGRGRTPSNPRALETGEALSGTTGPVLDPVFSLRVRVVVPPSGSVVVAFTTAVTESRDEALAIADQFRLESAVARVFELSWAHCQLEHRHRGWSPEEAHLFQRLGSHIIFAGSAQRADSAIVASNRQGQPSLWRYGISGDRPIVVARIRSNDNLALARTLLIAHAFLRIKGVEFDLVLLNEERSSYFEQTLSALEEAIRAAGASDLAGKPGGVFVAKSAQMSEADRTQLLAVARVVLDGEAGPLAAQLDRVERLFSLPPPLVPRRLPEPWDDRPVSLPDDLQIANGYGGFTPDGREYCILVESPESSPHADSNRMPMPPSPWINVIANPTAGFLVSESGSGYTWTVNSQSNRLTPWMNDPVSDPPGEVIYLRDEETGEFWCPTPLPVSTPQPTLVRHGQGYSVLERNTHGIEHSLLTLMPKEDSLKRVRLRLRNPGIRTRELSAIYYVEWVLGTTREATAMHVVTEYDEKTGAIFARNSFGAENPERVAFAAVDREAEGFTADRHEFLGRNGSASAPVALSRVGLSGRVGAVLDPCAALRVSLILGPGESTELTFLLGECDNPTVAREVLARHQNPGLSDSHFQDVQAHWNDQLGAIQVATPDQGMNHLLNRWLLDQVIACRLYARSALYQSGGAFGFRDQLQDVMAVVHAAPGLARAQILRAAARQFSEGDVQHWWHPQAGRGVRTRISDDFLWLPYVAAHYAKRTGDLEIFEETLPFLESPPLRPGQEDDYGLPSISSQTGTLYEHCLRAIERGMTSGAHGLPLMGTGDWNDGMNRVGSEGRGESVWVAWFLIATIREFSPLTNGRTDSARWSRIDEWAKTLRKAIESTSWDGDWYRRAYFDDGTPLGSALNDECQIDSIVQSWAVISGAGDPVRARTAMEAVDRRLVREQDRLILLFDPPFDSGRLTPGYIKGYLPGIRENGGQYTHAATWVVLANALLRRGRHAFDLFKMLDPTTHAEGPYEVERYKVEPYVVAADVYGRPPHVGRGGWTWYTGSAGWLYRVGLEAILGFQRQDDKLVIDPCIPADWGGFSITYRHGKTEYSIQVDNPQRVEHGVSCVRVDGIEVEGNSIALVDDGSRREVVVTLGPGA